MDDPLDRWFGSVEAGRLSRAGKPVPNVFPTIHAQPYRIAIIGEAPGKDEEDSGIPFVGASGRLLSGMLAKVGIIRDACFVGNVCQLRPPDNKIENFKWDGVEIQSGRILLTEDLAVFQPNLVVCLGATPLRLMAGSKESIEGWRGTLFRSQFGYKAMATIHPAACLREYTYTPLLHFDLKRAAVEGRTSELVLPKRNLNVDCNLERIIWQLELIKQEKPLISVDIEGGINSMSCLSIAESAETSFIIPFTGLGKRHFGRRLLLFLPTLQYQRFSRTHYTTYSCCNIATRFPSVASSTTPCSSTGSFTANCRSPLAFKPPFIRRSRSTKKSVTPTTSKPI